MTSIKPADHSSTPVLFVIFAVILLAPCVPVSAQDTAAYRIRGQVTDGVGEPVAGVRITCTGGLPEQVTNPFGKYEVPVPDRVAEYVVTATKDGYQFIPATRKVWVSAADAEASFGAQLMAAAEPPNRLAAPTFQPAAPRTFGNSIQVIISCADADAIRYTTDGTDPWWGPTGTVFTYTGPLTLTRTTTLKARAYLFFQSGWSAGAMVSGTYTQLTVAKPTFSPSPPKSFTGSIAVTISCTTSGATIRYTTDGTNPTGASAIYTGQLTFTGTTTLKARAYKSGMADSVVASGTYTEQVVATPVFTPAAPLAFLDSVQVAISCATSGATIRYTTNGNDPTPASTIYTNHLTITSTTTLKAKAFKAGVPASVVVNGRYTQQPVATPTFSPVPPRTFSNSINVTISCPTSGATIRYTIDGSAPTASSATYTTTLTLMDSTTLKAKAFKGGVPDSAVASGTYTESSVAPPTFTPTAPCVFVGSVKVGILCATSGVTIRYTTDGSDPTASSTTYTKKLKLADTTTLKAKAFKGGVPDSAVATGTYEEQPVATPTLVPAAPASFTGTQKVKIKCATSGAAIRYTTDGSNPTAASLHYSGTVILTATTTVKAKAFKVGVPDSAVVSGTFTKQ